MALNLIDSLPDDAYIKLTNYLSVNAIKNLGESEIAARTDLAFEKLEHAVIYGKDLCSESAKTALENDLRELSPLFKSIHIYDNGHEVMPDEIFDNDVEVDKFTKMFPKLEKFRARSIMFLKSYIDKIGTEDFNLKEVL